MSQITSRKVQKTGQFGKGLLNRRDASPVEPKYQGTVTLSHTEPTMWDDGYPALPFQFKLDYHPINKLYTDEHWQIQVDFHKPSRQAKAEAKKTFEKWLNEHKEKQ
ncbi:hypothetical protein [Vibrio rotiferianus]|uniref:hypothetical protein n=1 Tax=Vibrio rotiferianus TaxID=190895 RepID=UPI00023771E6|nr:hypothetical protein [Vibrio rotiferianus]